MELHLSIWDQDKEVSFLGHLVIPLQHFEDGIKSEDWYCVYDKPGNYSLMISTISWLNICKAFIGSNMNELRRKAASRA
jgi:hypothetical protein